MNQMKAFAMLLAMVASSAAQAEDSGFYVGAGAGVTTQNNAVFHGSDTSFRLLAGYSLNRYFAVEGGYADGGTQTDSVGTRHVDASAKGAFAAVLGKLPIGERFAPYAKFGYAFYDATSTATGGTQRTTIKITADRILFGGGVEMKLGEHGSLRADYEKVRVPNVAYDVYSIIATWRF